ncbi:PREDICTED: WAT1-related protein At3g02690, chloroplastic [Tarenaya hassleriana]|uniref:WAT1-related protein At3g02690, chloroplastic n=1 Tax=Tarenaya hassleriana TaxID=28532 RepID=UPI00053C3736|nr:PREDICTED: WAT1-related protein At3g02690, chloroplastic [Tarenaya hassleriana]
MARLWPSIAAASSSSSSPPTTTFFASLTLSSSRIGRANSNNTNSYPSINRDFPSITPLCHRRFCNLKFLDLVPGPIRKRRVYGDSVAGRSTASSKNPEDTESQPSPSPMDCVGTGLNVECVTDGGTEEGLLYSVEEEEEQSEEFGGSLLDWAVLVSPFFFWGTAMVAMKEVLPKAGPFFVAAFRLIPAGLLLVAFAAYRRRPSPSGFPAWFSIAVFALVDAACFQGFLAQGLQRTSAGLGSVIIDSQPLTVAVLAALLFGESIGIVRAGGLVLGVLGLLLLEIPSLALEDESNFSLWGSGEWWMLLAAQSMAVGTVMVRWVTKYSDPIMATGWHMVIGGIPLLAISFLNNDPAFNGSIIQELTTNDIVALLYTSIFGSAVSYGVFFYSATKGSLTKLSSLTFLTPMFASIFGFLYLNETFSPLQLAGAAVTLVAIYMVNFQEDIA